MTGCGLTHILGCIEAECDGGDAGFWPIEACQCPGRAARLLRFQVPERAVERVASGAGRQCFQQAFRGQARPPQPRARPRSPRAFAPVSRHSGDRGRPRHGRCGGRRRLRRRRRASPSSTRGEMRKAPLSGHVSRRTVRRRPTEPDPLRARVRRSGPRLCGWDRRRAGRGPCRVPPAAARPPPPQAPRC